MFLPLQHQTKRTKKKKNKKKFKINLVIKKKFIPLQKETRK
jgi:hypothetical protein